MAGRLDAVGTIAVEIALRQDRVDRAGFVGAGYIAAAIYDLRMLVRRAAFRGEQVIPAIHLVDMRAFGPDRVVFLHHAAIDQQRRLPDQPVAGKVEFADPDGAVAFVTRGADGRVVISNPAAAVLVDIERRIDAAEIEDHRIGPGTRRIGRGDEEVAITAYAGVEDVIGAVVIGDGRRIETVTGQRRLRQVDHARAVDGVADLLPVHEVAAVQDRQAGEPREGGVHHVEIVPHLHDRGIGVETGQYGVGELSIRDLGSIAFIAKVIEGRRGRCCSGGRQQHGCTRQHRCPEFLTHWIMSSLTLAHPCRMLS